MADPRWLRELLAQFEPAIRKAFYDTIRQGRNQIVVAEAVRLLDAGDVEGAIQALSLDAEDFDQLAGAIRNTFVGGGNAMANSLGTLTGPGGARVRAKFGGFDPRTLEIIQDHVGALITEITDDTKYAARSIIEDGYHAGRHTRRIALDIVGRIDGSGRRMGGTIGLHSQQVEWVMSARSELLNGDNDGIANYLTRRSRDKRFDRVARDIREYGLQEATRLWNQRTGRSDSSTRLVDRMTGRMSDILLRKRGEVIARTEARWAARAGQYDGLRQQVDKGLLRPSQITLTWDAASDTRTRDSHLLMEGQEVQFGQPFVSNLTGAQMRFPGDVELGAPPSETISCRCRMAISVNKISGLRGDLTANELAAVREAM